MLKNPLLGNAFCPTGKGGGIDPSCSSGGTGKASKAVKDWAAKRFSNPEHAKAFVEWFGDSKVVDENGEPLVVYHGTTAEEFNEFKPKNRAGEQLGFGIHFAESKNLADEYSTGESARKLRKSGTARVESVYLQSKKPLDATAIVKDGTPEFALAKKLAGNRLMTQTDSDGKKIAYMQGSIDATSGKRAEKLIREAGYDSVKYEASIISPSGGGRYIQGEKSISYVVFESKQVKSAANNQGTFDPDDPVITNEREGYGGVFRFEVTQHSRGPY